MHSSEAKFRCSVRSVVFNHSSGGGKRPECAMSHATMRSDPQVLSALFDISILVKLLIVELAIVIK